MGIRPIIPLGKEYILAKAPLVVIWKTLPLALLVPPF